ncbi:MAG: 3-dehydroquinate synthase [Bacteroidetes bacterium]|nr:3-dehydroquinate synthase [Bacteroidota bacterium]
MERDNSTKLIKGKYPIYIGKGILKNLNSHFPTKKFSQVAVLTDTNVEKYWLSTLISFSNNRFKSIIIPAGEKSKNIFELEYIWKKMFEFGFDRKSLLINLGGGMICDIGGFAASTFMRGIDFINIPTTLLAQVDASIGGKNGINYGEIKNGVGSFKMPIGVLSDTETLQTLDEKEFVSSFAEIIKHGIISGKKYFNLISKIKPLEFHQNELIKIIFESIKIKKRIVDKDPHENKLRKILNFGHTIGHAIEIASLKLNKPLLHGDAIAIGMIAESRLALMLGKLPEKEFNLIENLIIKANLKRSIKNIPVNLLLDVIKLDKKNLNGNILFSLPSRIGKVEPNIRVNVNQITKSIEYITK